MLSHENEGKKQFFDKMKRSYCNKKEKWQEFFLFGEQSKNEWKISIKISVWDSIYISFISVSIKTINTLTIQSLTMCVVHSSIFLLFLLHSNIFYFVSYIFFFFFIFLFFFSNVYFATICECMRDVDLYIYPFPHSQNKMKSIPDTRS